MTNVETIQYTLARLDDMELEIKELMRELDDCKYSGLKENDYKSALEVVLDECSPFICCHQHGDIDYCEFFKSCKECWKDRLNVKENN